jgi:hypothetical protein
VTSVTPPPTTDARAGGLKQAATGPQAERRLPITPGVAHGRAAITATDRT